MAATDATKFLNKTEYERTLARLRQYCDQKESSVTEEASFLYRKSPDVGNRDYFVAKSVKGKTLVWNQLIVNGNLSNGTNGWSRSGSSTILASNGVLTVTITATPTSNYTGYVAKPFSKTSGHKYYFHVEVNVPHDGRFILDTNSEIQTQLYDVSANKWEKLSSIASAVRDGLSGSLFPRELSDGYVSGDSFKIRNYYVIDLTLMFGAGNEPATVEEFESMFPLPYYDYNPGELISFNADGIQTVGRNLVDINTFPELTGRGEIDANGAWHLSSLSVGVTLWKNTIGYTGRLYYDYAYKYANGGNKGAGQRFKFVYTDGTSSLGVHSTIGKVVESFQTDYGTFVESWISDVFLYFLTDPQTDGTDGYIPYKSSTLNLSIPSMTSGGVQIFPDGMRSAGDVYDEAIVEPDGYVRKVVKRLHSITFTGQEAYWNYSSAGVFYSNRTGGNNPDAAIVKIVYTRGRGICSHFGANTPSAGVPVSGTWDITDNFDTWGMTFNRSLVSSLASSTSVNDWKAWLAAQYQAGTPLIVYYELATPVSYTLDEPIFVGSGFNGGGIQTVIQENTSAPHTTPFSGSFEYGRMPAMDVISLVNESSNMITSRYLPLTGGTMSGAIKFPTGNREILHFAGTDASWGSGLKYSWSNRTTIAFWGKHAETAFVWNAGTDYSATDVPSSGTSYDFKIQRVSGVPNVTTTGKYIGTAFVKKDGTSSQFLKADGSVDSNTYATAAQLTNGSVTKLGTATVGSSTMPIYLNAGTPAAISSFPEAYLSWGGKNFTAAYGPIDAAMVSELGACRTMFAKAAGIVVEYSTDGGETWLDYGLTDSQKVGLFSSGQTVNTGKNTIAGGASPNNMLRVSLRTSAAGIYTSLNKFVLYVNTNGSSGSYCTIRCRTQQNYEDNVDTWVVRADHVGIGGWSGWNVINIDATTTYGNTKASQYGEWQFIFGYTGANANYAGLIVNKIFGFGGVGWTTPSYMASTGHLYTFDSGQNAYFPATVAPISNGLKLGYDGRRWELYATAGNFSGALTTTGGASVGGTLTAGATTIQRTLANSDFNALTIANKGSWNTAHNTLAGVNVTDGTGTVGKFGIGFDGKGYFVVKGLYNSGYNNTGEVFKVSPDGTTIGGTLTTSGNITTSGYVAVGTGRNNGSYIGSDSTGNIFLHNFSGFPLVADGLVVRRGAAATTATLGNTTYPWAGVYSKTGNFSDAVTLSGTTAATRRIYFGDTSHYLELDSTGFHFSHGVYSDSFISAGGVSQSGGSGGPIEINTDDFAEVDGVLQLADRTTSNGMGYIILRKDMSFASQITKTNTIYEVRYSFNLSGASVTIPSNCVLKFVGGMLVNGTVTGTNTKIDAPFVRIFSDNVSLAGTWALDKFPVSWYGGEVNDSSVDISAVISKILEQFVTIFPGRNASGGHPYGGAKITLLEGAYYAKTPIVIYDYSPTSNGEGLNPMDGTSACEIEGSSKYGTYIHNSNTGDNFFLTNLRDGTHRHHWGLTLRFLTFIGGNGIKMVRPWDFHIEHCTFYNGATAIKFFATVNTHINDCSFYNTVTAIEFDSSMGGGGVSTTFTIENCWIAWCRIGFKLSSIRTGDGFEFIIRNSIFEYCRASLQVQSISERNTLLVDECYFEGNPPDITTYGNTSTIEGVDCYFRHCLTDPIDYGFVKNGTCRFYWEGYMKPKLTLGDTTASKNVTIVVDGKTLYNNYDNHIVKTAGFFDEKPGILYASEIGDAGAVRVNVRSGDDMNEGLWEWDGQGYSLSKEIAQTKAISYENSSFVFSKTSTDATFEAWLSGDKNTALVGPWIAKLQAKFSGFTGRETPLKKLLATLGAGNNSALWQKIKHLHFPVLALPSDGANVGYDLITDTVRTLNSYTIYANRGVYPTSGGGNTGALTVSGVSAANISFFGIVTYRADTLSIGSSAAECVYDQGYRINFNKQSMGFINASAEFGSIAYSDLNAEVPIAFAMSANTGSARTICKGSTSKSVSETAYGAVDSYQLSGQRSYAATSVFAICDGLTPAEALTASTALATFATEFGILGNSNQ